MRNAWMGLLIVALSGCAAQQEISSNPIDAPAISKSSVIAEAAAPNVEPAVPIAQPADVEKEVRKRAAIANLKKRYPKLTPVSNAQVSLCYLQFSPKKLAKANSAKYGGNAGQSVLALFHQLAIEHNSSTGTQRSSELRTLIDALRKDHMVTIAASPTLLVKADEPAHYHVGKKEIYPTKDANNNDTAEIIEYGTSFDVDPTFLAKEIIAIDYSFEVRTLEDNNHWWTLYRTLPGTKYQTSALSIEVEPGTTFVAMGWATSGDKSWALSGGINPAVYEGADEAELFLLTTTLAQ